MTEAKKFNWSYVFDEPTRILVIDDDPILREFASVYLSTPEAVVETAPNGNTALDLLLKGQFDIVLVDIEMPELDGFEIVQRLRAHENLQHLPIVMLTGREDIASIDRAYNLGATSFVTKPVNWRELSYQLRYIIRASRMEALRLMPAEFADAVSSMVAYANLIADRNDPASSAHARSIAALGQELLGKLPARPDAPLRKDADQPARASARNAA
jgi:DNA-binding response OmpR family regulator